MVAKENAKKGGEVLLCFWTGFGFMVDPPNCGEIRKVRARVTSRVRRVMGQYANVGALGVEVAPLEPTGNAVMDQGLSVRLDDTVNTEGIWLEEAAAQPGLETVELSRGTRLSHSQKERPEPVYALVYQRSRADPGVVRAVIKDGGGAIVARGPAVPEAEALRSANVALTAPLSSPFTEEAA